PEPAHQPNERQTHLTEGPPSSTRPALPRRPTDTSVSTTSTQPVKAMTHAMRIGFNYVRDLGEDGRKAIVDERARAPSTSFDDFLPRLRGAPVGPRAVRNLVMVGGF